MTEKEILWLSKVLSVGILVTFSVISPVGFVQIATFPPPVVNASPTVFPDTRDCSFCNGSCSKLSRNSNSKMY